MPETSMQIWPWIGSDYERQGGLLSVRILVLRESYRIQNDELPNLDYKIIQKQIAAIMDDRRRFDSARAVKSPFWDYVFSLAQDSLPTLPSRQFPVGFLNAIAHHVYLQKVLTRNDADVANPHLLQSSANAFREVVRELRPRCLLVFGKALWDRLPAADSIDSHLVVVWEQGERNWPMTLYHGGDGSTSHAVQVPLLADDAPRALARAIVHAMIRFASNTPQRGTPRPFSYPYSSSTLTSEMIMQQFTRDSD